MSALAFAAGVAFVYMALMGGWSRLLRARGADPQARVRIFRIPDVWISHAGLIGMTGLILLVISLLSE